MKKEKLKIKMLRFLQHNAGLKGPDASYSPVIARVFCGRRAGNRFITPENVLLVLYVIYTLWMMSLHTMWRDEGQAWLIARDRPSLINLIATINYEGTPALWHTCLYIFNHLLNLPWISMLLWHSALNIAAVYLFIKKTNFHFITKLLFCGSYLIAYEYNIIARSYVLILLLLFIWALLFNERFSKQNYYAVVLGLLAQTSAFGFLISVVLGGNYLCELLLSIIRSGKHKVMLNHLKRILIPTLIIIFGLIFAYWQMRQSPDSAYHFASFADHGYALERLIRIMFRGSTAITPDILYAINARFLFDLLYTTNLEVYLGLMVLIAAIALMFKKVKIGWMYLETLVVLGIFYWYTFHFYGQMNALRYWGIFFVLFLSFSIVINSELKRLKQSNLALEVFIILLLLLQVCRSFILFPEETNRRYSSGKEMAQYLLAHDLVKTSNVAIYPAYTAAAILPYLPNNVRFYFPENAMWGSYMLWSRQWSNNQNMGYSGMLAKVMADKNLNHQIEYFITNERITVPWCKAKVDLIYNWSGSVMRDENFYLYRRKR